MGRPALASYRQRLSRTAYKRHSLNWGLNTWSRPVFIRFREKEIMVMDRITGRKAHQKPWVWAENLLAYCIISPRVVTLEVDGPRPSMESWASARIPEEICRIRAITT